MLGARAVRKGTGNLKCVPTEILCIDAEYDSLTDMKTDLHESVYERD